MTITIAPCPFCEFDDVEIDQTGDLEFQVFCPECRAAGPIDTKIMGAINLWNVRAPERLRNIAAHAQIESADGDGVYKQ